MNGVGSCEPVSVWWISQHSVRTLGETGGPNQNDGDAAFTDEFKAEAVAVVASQCVRVSSVARP